MKLIILLATAVLGMFQVSFDRPKDKDQPLTIYLENSGLQPITLRSSLTHPVKYQIPPGGHIAFTLLDSTNGPILISIKPDGMPMAPERDSTPTVVSYQY